MAQFLYKTVKPSDGDYTTLESCLNANEQDLTGDGWFDVEIDGTWSSADTTAVIIHNYTTTDSDYINIYTTSACRHPGHWSDSSPYYRLKIDSVATSCIYLTDTDYITITGLQMYSIQYRGVEGGAKTDSSNQTVIDSSVIKSADISVRSWGGTNEKIDIINTACITDGDGTYGVVCNSTDSVMNVYNCVVIDSGSGYAVIKGAGTTTAINTYAYSASGTAFQDFDTVTTCASDDGSQSTTTVAYSTSSGAYFTNVTSGSEDFHITSESSGLYNTGTDLSGTVEDDIDGMYRGDEWSIGIDNLYSTKVMPSGGDYTTLEGAMNAHEQDLTSKGWMNVCIDGTWASADSSAVTIHNYTTSSTDYINIYTTSACRHPGYYSNASPYYRLVVDAQAGTVLNCQDPNVKISGLQVRNTATETDTYTFGVDLRSAGNMNQSFIWDANIFICDGTGSSPYVAGLYIDDDDGVIFTNSIFQGAENGCVSYYDYLGDGWQWLNCVFIGGTNGFYQVNSGNYGATIKNSYAHGGTTGFNITGTYVNLTTCASSDGSESTTTVAYSTSSGAYFTNVTAGSEDFHITSASSGLYDAGTDLSGTFNDDIDGDTRTVWSIGVDEAPASTKTYSRGDYASLPADDTALENSFTSGEYTQVETNDADRVAQTATSEFAIFLFKDQNTNSTDGFTVTWDGQSSTAPSVSTVYLQVYNQNGSTWEALDSDNATGANTDFELSGSVTTSVSNYYAAGNVVSCRVYQEDL